MKLLDKIFRTRLESGIVTTCLCWKLVRRDGQTVCVTDHDEPVSWQGAQYETGASLDSGRFENAGGLRPGRAAVAGGLSADGIEDEELAAGLWNGARVHVYRVDWTAPGLGTLVWTGYLSDITQSEAGFEAELISLKADLERPLGRRFSRHCDAQLGDARCGLSGVGGQICDKRFDTCRDVFGNAINFRGFPHMPGQDFILAGPAASGNDGGKR